MRRRLHRTLMVLLCLSGAPAAVGHGAGAVRRASWRDWRHGTAGPASAPPGGQWGITIGTMDGRVLWSVSPELELVPASTTKLFTTGFSRTRMGGGARFTTRVIGDGRLDTVERQVDRHLGAGAGRRSDPGSRGPRGADAP